MTPLSLGLALLVQAAPATPAPAAQPDPAAEQKAWHTQRMERLKAEDGWLTLVGLHWLEEGDTKLGSAPDNALQLPASVPPLLGTLTRQGKQVRFTPAPGVSVKVSGKPFAGGPLRPDSEGAPDVVEAGTLRFHLISRQGRLGVRVRDTASPARSSFQPIPLFAYDPAWRVEARLEKGQGPTTVAVPNVLGSVEQMKSPGTLVFRFGGKEHRLVPVVEEGDDSLFLIFADPTNRKESYGAGRFLYAPLPVDGKTVLDFNRATNPPCAFTRFATCPLPPRANRLAVRVEAGEKRPVGGEH